ncbi:hypothetical protein L208DRAFT_1378082 [Tricholoma matsutake]|nr:hypothetical protein L208DRAFT_1378082 [Tricholoma matsutake 945]
MSISSAKEIPSPKLMQISSQLGSQFDWYSSQCKHKTKGKLQGGAKLLSKPKPCPDGHAGVYEIVDLTILPEIIEDLTVYCGKTFTTDNNKGMQKVLLQNVALLYGLDRDIPYIYTPRFHAVLKAVESDYDEHGIPLHLQGDNSSSTFQILTHSACISARPRFIQEVFCTKNIVVTHKPPYRKLEFDEHGMRTLATRMNKELTIHSSLHIVC